MSNQTIFILAGGADRSINDYGPRLGVELRKHVAQKPKLLSCFFSAPESDWPTKCQNWQAWFEESFDFAFKYEYACKATFLQQIDDADIVYLHGGDTQLLFDSLPDADALKDHFKGKIIVGSSAGANVLAKNYWSSSRAVPDRGLGIVDVNVMVHYGQLNHQGFVRTVEDWRREEAEFQKFIGEGEAITHLPEGQFIVRTLVP